MDCGVPFCQSGDGCPVRLIPSGTIWSTTIAGKKRWIDCTNVRQFPGVYRSGSAPCEGACALASMNRRSLSRTSNKISPTKALRRAGLSQSTEQPQRQEGRCRGLWPAGLAAAAQLNQAGHEVTVYERDDRIGGLLMYGIPNMKLENQSLTGG